MTDTGFDSLCGSCTQKLTKEDYEELVWTGLVTMSCGHTSRLGELQPGDADAGIKRVFVPLGAEGRELKTNAATKKATWFVLSRDENLEASFGEDCDRPNDLLPMHTLAGAWDAFWSGSLGSDAEAPLYLYELKCYRFMDFNPKVTQSLHGAFDTKEYEGSRFISRDYDPGSLGVVLKRSYVRLIKKTPVTVADAPSGSVYGTRVLDQA